MSPSATKTRPKTDVLAELGRLEAVHSAAGDEAEVLGREFADKLRRAQELHKQREALRIREPGLVDHTGAPNENIEDNPVLAIDKQLTELGDLEDLQAKREHLRRIAERAKVDVDRHKAEHYEELLAARRPHAEATTEAVHGAVRAALEQVDAYLVEHHRSVGLTEPIRGIDGRYVPGVNEAAQLKRTLEAVDLPVPLPGDRRLA